MRGPILLLALLAGLSGCGNDESAPAPSPAPPKAPGPPLVQGIVVDELGSPVADAIVNARLPYGGGVKGWQSGVRDVTDEKGEFSLDIEGKLKPSMDAPVRVLVTREGYIPAHSEIPSYGPGRGQWLQVRLRLGGTIEGRVLTVAGEPVGGATAYLILPFRNGAPTMNALAHADTDAAGRYRIESVLPGTYDIGVKAPGCIPSLRGPVEIVAGEKTDAPDLEVRAGKSIAGRVLTPAGVPVKRARVRAFQNKIHRDLAVFGRNGIGEAGGMAKAAEDGTFVIDGLAEGSYTVEADAMGYHSIHASRSGVAPGTEDVELSLAPETIVRITVLDAVTGKPIPRFFAAVTALGGATGMSFKEEVSSLSGRFEFAARLRSKYQVEVSAEGYEVAIKQIEPVEGETLQIRVPLVAR